eukprot:1518091-Pyramimonas_sp.AAC.1
MSERSPSPNSEAVTEEALECYPSMLDPEMERNSTTCVIGIGGHPSPAIAHQQNVGLSPELPRAEGEGDGRYAACLSA